MKRDELNEKLVKLEEAIEKLKKDHEAEIEALEDERKKLEEMVAFVDSFLSGVDGAFATLCLAHKTGNITSADLKTFAEQSELSIPDELQATEEAGEEDTGDPNNFAQTG